MKFAKIFICTILMVAILSVTCFATNEGLYGHYVSSGTYNVRDNISYTYTSYSYDFEFVSNGITFTNITYDGNLAYFRSATDELVVFYGSESDVGTWVNDAYQVIEIVEPFYIYDSQFYSWFSRNILNDLGSSISLVDQFLSVFTFIGQWISGAAEDLTVMFWADNSLTFVGTLAVASLAMAVSFLIIGLISRFLRFRG